MLESEQYTAGSYKKALYEASSNAGLETIVLCALGVAEGTEDGRPRDRPPKENDCSRRREKTAKSGVRKLGDRVEA